MSRAFRADLAAGRQSSPHPGELRLAVGGIAYAGETVIWYRADYAPEPMITCAVCNGRCVAPDGLLCGMCNGRGEYRDPIARRREVRRHALSRYTVKPGDNWRAPDLCEDCMYYAVLVDDNREEPPLEWEDLQTFGIQRSEPS